MMDVEGASSEDTLGGPAESMGPCS